jgi:hypothetical protein
MIHPVQIAKIQAAIITKINSGNSSVEIIVKNVRAGRLVKQDFNQGINKAAMAHKGDPLIAGRLLS